MSELSFASRLSHIQKLQEKEFDLLIVGGGINGAGIARDAASRGMSVALVEKADFASGTSSRSSKLIHGGIRYLENMEFHLVFEALSERTKLFEMTPHLVHHLRFMIPIYKESRVGMFTMGMGMWLYDALSLFRAPELHERLSPEETINRMPSLRAENLKGSFVYSDGYMDDDRLVHETLRSASQEGALCVNYVSAEKPLWNENKTKITQLECRDQLTGKLFCIRARHIVGSVGPWTDELGARMDSGWKKMLRPTKGIHITLPRSRLKLDQAVVMGAEKGDRIVFGIPRKNMIIVGTTDTDYSISPDGVVANAEDIEYLLSFTKQYFPGAQIQKKDIIASYAGVRPLVKDDASSEGKTSREHVIWQDPSGVTYVAGGKYTTYRLMSEQVVEKVLHAFPIEDQVRFRKNSTLKPLNEWTSLEAMQNAIVSVSTWAKEFDRTESEVLHFAERFGMETYQILTRAHPSWTLWQIEAAQAIETTMCLDLVDFFARRVPLFLADPAHGATVLNDVAQIFQQKLRWTDQKVEEQKQKFFAYQKSELAWK